MPPAKRIETPYRRDSGDQLIGDITRQPVGSWTWRPKGTPDWLFMATISGKAQVVTSSGISHDLYEGDLLAIEPRVPHDFGPTDRAWKVCWVHAPEHVSWRSWLRWEQLESGIHLARLRGNAAWIPAYHSMKEILQNLRTLSEWKTPLAVNALERMILLASSATVPKGTAMDFRIARAISLLSKAIPPHPSQLGTHCGLSYSRLARIFHRHTGLTLGEYREHILMERAMARLLTTRDPIKAIADDLGFSCPFYFSRRFRRYAGVSPDFYRRKHRH